MEDKKKRKDKPLEKLSKSASDMTEFSIEEFSIVELEDRLELATRCNNNCSCP